MSKIIQRVIVRVEYLLATEPFQSTEETRYYLNGIYIEPHQTEGAVLVATDGHTMSVINDRHAIVQGDSAIWHMPWAKVLKAPITAYRKTCRHMWGHIYADMTHELGVLTKIRLVNADMAADVFNGDGIEFYAHANTSKHTSPGLQVIDGSFPAWRRVVPREQPADVGSKKTADVKIPAFNGSYLAKLAGFGQALAAAASSDAAVARNAPLSIYSPHPDGPGIARYGQDVGFVVIMPMRMNSVSYSHGLPYWLDEPAKEALEA